MQRKWRTLGPAGFSIKEVTDSRVNRGAATEAARSHLPLGRSMLSFGMTDFEYLCEECAWRDNAGNLCKRIRCRDTAGCGDSSSAAHTNGMRQIDRSVVGRQAVKEGEQGAARARRTRAAAVTRASDRERP